MEIKDIVHKSPSKNPLYIEFTACLCELMPDKVLTSFTHSCCGQKVGHAYNI